MNRYRFLSWALCIALLMTMPSLLLSKSPFRLGADDLQRIEQKIRQRVNYERSSKRIPELNWNEQLASEARRHALNIATRNFFAHKDPMRGDIDRRLDASGIRWLHCAENIYAGTITDLAEAVVASWRLSPGHSKNMLDSVFSETGVGVAVRRDGTIIVVQEFILK